MPPPKKAAKKAAKKAPGHHHDKHHQANDLRRAYEHMGRVAVLQQTSKSSTTDAVAELTTLAQRAIKDGHCKDAADLLRASEHLSFAVLVGEVAGVVRISAELKQSITEHFDELTRRAEEHWDEKKSTPISSPEYIKVLATAVTRRSRPALITRPLSLRALRKLSLM